MVDIAPPMAVLPMPEMSVNWVPSWFQLEIVWLIGDVTMPLTLPTLASLVPEELEAERRRINKVRIRRREAVPEDTAEPAR